MKNSNLTISLVTPKTVLGNIKENINNIIDTIKCSSADVIVFPELSITGTILGDWVLNKEFTQSYNNEFLRLIEEVDEKIVIVGGLLIENDSIYNVINIIHNKKIAGVVPKNYSNSTNKLELRQFSVGMLNCAPIYEINNVKFGIDFNNDDLDINHFDTGLLNSDIIINPSSSIFSVNKNNIRKEYIKEISTKSKIPYCYVTNGITETSSDVVYGSCQYIFDDEFKLEYFNYSFENIINNVEVNINKNIINSIKFSNTISNTNKDFIEKYPFKLNKESCIEAIKTTNAALYKRLSHIGIKSTVIGVSGGLDSTLALLFLYDCYKEYNIALTNIYGITMPGLATSNKTKSVAVRMMEKLGITSLEMPIKVQVENHLKLIGHDGVTKDVTYENAQARYRTYILMNYANLCKGLVIGTSDLSEIALGWSTFNGDQIAMYGLNSGIPKTAVKELVAYFSEKYPFIKEELMEVLDLPITPELTGNDQFTEVLIGRYDINDFLIYYVFGKHYSKEVVCKKIVEYFNISYEEANVYYDRLLRRFKQNQFKRYASCEGVKIFDISLSPRLGYIFPGDMK